MASVEFSDVAKANAAKFLADFTADGAAPVGEGEADLPAGVTVNWPSISDEEVEGECLAIARSYLAKRGCPGILSYHLSAEASRQLLQSGRVEGCREIGGEEEEKPRLKSTLVAKELLSVLYSVCGEWAKSLPLLTMPPGKIELSCHAIKNSRRKMEDRHILCVDVNSLFGIKDQPSQAFYGVLDGHIGVEAAVYSSVHLLPNVVRHPSFPTEPEVALKEGILTTDQRYCEKGIRSGTTAVVTLIRGEQLYVAWLGDSQAWLVRQGRPVQLMDPHKPDREDEQKRIEEAGGMVLWMGAWRVNGNLSVSRAIGDPGDKKYIIGEADVRSFVLDGTEDYLVVACDGVWDVVNGEELTECVQQHFAKGGTKNTVAKAIVDFAKSEGSGDNMTAIVVFFNGFQPEGQTDTRGQGQAGSSADTQSQEQPGLPVNSAHTPAAVEEPSNSVGGEAKNEAGSETSQPQ